MLFRSGVERSARREANLARLERLVELIPPLPVSMEVAHRFGRLKADLGRRGLSKGDVDLFVASTAIEAGATLVSTDEALLDGSIPDLSAENWLGSTS